MQVNAHRDAPKRNAHSTKSGPGRRHVQGEKHGTAPVPSKGIFLGQHTNPGKNERRKRKAAVGARQLRKQERYWRDPMRWVEIAAEQPLQGLED